MNIYSTSLIIMKMQIKTTMKYHLSKSIIKEKKNVDEHVEKLGPSYIVDKNVKLEQPLWKTVGSCPE